ncbi:MAG TPA: CoA transferase [Rhodospirillaceae bacterium]|nr:CoA transferase [Rhodospirillaceae bacterium]
MTGALEGIRILDLSRVLAGPVCTQILGDLGAEILKIEKPGEGDDTRYWGPPFLKDTAGNDTSESAYYLSANRNKKSLAIDIKTKEGQALIHKLLEKSDVLIENFKKGGLEKYGLGYEQIKAKYPRLIYCSITGFGLNGPLSSEPGYDYLAQAMGGLMAITGEPGGSPMKVGVALSDFMTGLYAAIGILAALRARDTGGKGQLVDLSLLDCTVSSLVNIGQYYLTAGKPAPRMGNAHATIVPYQTFKTADGFVVIAIGNDGQFKKFCDAAGNPAWAADEKFSTNKMRVQNRTTLIPLIEKCIAGKTTAHWLDVLREADVPCGPVNTIDKVFEMDQVQARDMAIEMKHDAAPRPVKLVGSPLKLSETPVSYTAAPPMLGQHTGDVLETLLGLSRAEIKDLEKKGII